MLTRRFVAAYLFVMALVLLGALPAQAQLQLRLEQAGFSSKTVTDNGPGDADPVLGRITYSGAYGAFTVTVNTGVSKPVIGNGTTQADMDLNSSEFTTSTGGTLQITLVDTGFSFPNNNSGNLMTLTSSVGGTFDGIVGGPPAGTSVTFKAWANAANASPLSVDPSVIPAGSVGVAPMGPFLTSPYSQNSLPVNFTKGAGPYSIFNQATVYLPGPGQVGFDHFTRVEGTNCTGKLGNYVWNDLNHNGIQESGEPGIPGITVTLLKNGNPSATTTTDASGLYQFTGLCAASYTVEVPPQAGLTGYVASPTLQGGDFSTDSNPNPTTVSFITDNGDDQTIDFGYYIPNPHLTLQKSPKGGTFNQGDPVSFSFLVGNDGGSPALNVHLTDQLPGNGGLVWQVGTVSQGSCGVANNLLSCNLGTIQPSGSVTVTVTSGGGTPMAACQAQPNPVALATADGGLSATDSGSLNCVPPQLSIVKTPDGGTFAVGAAVTFTIVVSNPAPAGASPATNVTLTDTLPNAGGLVWNSATASQGSCTLTSNNLTCALGTIMAGASVTVTVSSTATTPASACQLQSNPVARATGDGGLDVQDSGSMDCTQPASLGDFVWHDLDADGVQDVGEPGIPGVTVTLLKCNGTPTGMTTTTNASGFYSFPNLTPDCYKVQFATPAGFTASPANQGANDAADSDSVGGLTGNYTLAPGDNNLTVDAGFYKPASLGDFVWNDVNINGVQNAGEPGIPGVTVVLLLCNGSPTGMTTTTNAVGFYQFTNLTPGCYKVQFATPANFTPTAANQGANDAADSDAVGGVTGNYTLNSGDNNLTVDAGFYSLPPGLTLVKSANVQITGPYQPVTYTYTVTNTGGTTLTNIVVTDDNGTPNFAGDDFTVGVIASLAPGASATLTATVIPVVSTVGVVNGNSVPAGAVIVVVQQANGDIKVTYLQSFGINDNTYGAGAIGWPSGHTFGNLTGSDKLEFRFFDKNGNMVLDIYQDYISATSLAPSGYASLCASGGDGSLVFGSLANIVSCTTSLADNLNNPLNLPNKAALIVNSPTSLVGGNVVIDPVKAPGGWNHINSYTVVVKASTFGSAGFGSVAVPDQHNSPNKLAGPNGMATTPTPSTVVNTARATANGGLTATATASVSIIPGSLGPASVSGFVYYDANNNGIKEPGEIGLGTTLTLTGTDSNGTPITRTTSSDGTTGAYSFTNLPPGNYKITETQPASYLQGKNSIGTVNGVLDGVLVPVDMIDSIDLESGDAGINFNFGEIVASTPNLTLVKTANQQVVGPYQPVTYTYTVTNTGATTLTNIVVTDDNGTPNFTSDDITIGVIPTLGPGASATLTAQIIPVVSTIGVVNGNNVPAGAVIVVVPQGNGDIKVTYLQSFGINDNTYGTGAIGWPNGHKFGDLTGSDKLEFRFFDKNGTMVLDLYQDYISTTSNLALYPSGYASLCASGGDGSLVFGSLANIVSCTTSLADNLNNPANLANKAALIVNSPTSLVGGNVVVDAVKAPGGWNYINSYTVVVKASTFGSAGFGSVVVPDQHNSPNKLAGPNGMATTPTNSTVVNTATATANGGLSANATASVAIVVPPSGGGACSAVITLLKLDKKDFQVTIKNNGASDIFLSGFALTWPALNGKLVQLKLDGDEVYGSPDIAGPSANLTAANLVGDQNKRKIGHGSSDTLHILFEANVDKTPAHYTDGLLTFGAGCTVSFP